ncbi:MAG: hypothetical protein R6W31_13710 [Bacteroidales bacterium]
MKKIFTAILPILGILMFPGCNKEDITEPRACFSVDVTDANVGEPVTFTNCSEGKAFSIWTGDSYHAFTKYGLDAGIAMDGETFIYTYPEPGTFTATIVATSYGNNGTEVYEDADSLVIHITDGRAELIEFGFRSPKVVGVISGHDIETIVPFGTDLTTLKATFKTSSKFAVVTVGGVEQLSGKTANDFTNPVEFIVTAQNGNTTSYLASAYSIPDTAKQLISFAIKGVPGIFDGNTIRVTLPAGNSNLSGLRAEFETSSSGAVVTVNGVAQTSGTTKNDFTNEVVYTVTAEDGSFNEYTVIVEEEIGFLSFGFEQLVPPVYGEISGYNLQVNVLQGTPVDSLYASFTTTAHNPVVKIGDVVQTSGVTLNNFSSPVKYTLEAQGKSVDYTVRVSIIK